MALILSTGVRPVAVSSPRYFLAADKYSWVVFEHSIGAQRQTAARVNWCYYLVYNAVSLYRGLTRLRQPWQVLLYKRSAHTINSIPGTIVVHILVYNNY